MRNINSRVKRRNKENKNKPINNTIESPCNKSLSDLKSIGIDKKNNFEGLNRQKREKNTENKEKLIEKIYKARIDVKMQSAIDMLYIKKREEILLEQKKERVNHIKNSIKGINHKRAISNKILKEANTSDDKPKQQKIAKLNKNTEISVKQLHLKEELENSLEYKENMIKSLPERSYSALISPRRSNFNKVC